MRNRKNRKLDGKTDGNTDVPEKKKNKLSKSLMSLQDVFHNMISSDFKVIYLRK